MGERLGGIPEGIAQRDALNRPTQSLPNYTSCSRSTTPSTRHRFRYRETANHCLTRICLNNDIVSIAAAIVLTNWCGITSCSTQNSIYEVELNTFFSFPTFQGPPARPVSAFLFLPTPSRVSQSLRNVDSVPAKTSTTNHVYRRPDGNAYFALLIACSIFLYQIYESSQLHLMRAIMVLP